MKNRIIESAQCDGNTSKKPKMSFYFEVGLKCRERKKHIIRKPCLGINMNYKRFLPYLKGDKVFL